MTIYTYIFPRYIRSSPTAHENTAILKVKWVSGHVNEIFLDPTQGRGWKLSQPMANDLVNRNHAKKPSQNPWRRASPSALLSGILVHSRREPPCLGTRTPPRAREPGPKLHRTTLIWHLAPGLSSSGC